MLVTTKKPTSEYNILFKCFDKPPDAKADDYLSKKKYRNKIMTRCPLKGKGGESFLYKSETNDKQIKICDLYSWIRSYTSINQNGVMKIRYYLKKPTDKLEKDGRFCRIVYYDTKLDPKDRIYLIFYKGDETVYKEKLDPRTGKNLKRTQPKIIKDIKEKKMKNHRNSTQIYYQNQTKI